MKIKTDTADLLIIDETPWLLGAILIVFILIFVGVGLGLVLDGVWQGLIFLVVGGGMGAAAFYLFVRRVQLVFYRPEGWVEIRRANILRHSRVRHTIDEISRAGCRGKRGQERTALPGCA
ncbi:MAG: Serpentine type 7TM GPCR chemoreceptor Srh [Rhodobacteraceae bacterium HLUCCO07]|nr:MAG: Serpentine type 7TM GPCR chemoreceptor Srh [Rhodobacteraceae bacterium HLUCCO07]